MYIPCTGQITISSVLDNRFSVDASQYVRNCIHFMCSSLIPITFQEQNPYSGIGPVVKKAMIVCPVSLVNVRLDCFLGFLLLIPLSELEE